MMIEKELLKQTYGNGRLCPVVEKPYDECYFVKMKSQDIAMAMFYCYENFEICGIYRSGEYCAHAPSMAMKLKQISRKMIVGLIALIFFAALMTGNAFASLYGQSVDFQDLVDQRTFSSENYNPGSSIGGLTGLWPGFSISWDISYDTTALLWNYEYTLQGSKAISHFVLEVTNPAEVSDFTNIQVQINNGAWTPYSIVGPEVWFGQNPSNPGLPTPLYGIKFDTGANLVSYSFQTANDPVWGNFYAKDGKIKGQDVYAYNDAVGSSGFNSDNKLDFIPRPDGGNNTPMAPEPVSTILFLSGGAVLTVRNYIKKRKI
jgi:hypothetical protein